jgi:hypothetical protein
VCDVFISVIADIRWSAGPGIRFKTRPKFYPPAAIATPQVRKSTHRHPLRAFDLRPASGLDRWQASDQTNYLQVVVTTVVVVLPLVVEETVVVQTGCLSLPPLIAFSSSADRSRMSLTSSEVSLLNSFIFPVS